MPGITQSKTLITKTKSGQKARSLKGIRSLARPDEWAMQMRLRVDARPFSLEGREYVRQVIRDYSPEIVIPKAAQMAFTVTFVTKSLHNVVERGWNGLYLLPIKTGAIPFVQARIDPVIDAALWMPAAMTAQVSVLDPDTLKVVLWNSSGHQPRLTGSSSAPHGSSSGGLT